tara:strand:- start:176 stop:1186 length:1011 start_codon:yes stop_codon:yes gene_type:complete
MKPVAFIDLFCGMGGFTVGAINAGATCIMSVDNWNEACAVHRANHSTIPVTQMELGHPDHWRFFKRMVDDYRSRGYHIHIHGSPPCQALSNASTRSAEEGMPLVLWYLDLVKKCEPDSWSMENVVPVRKKLPEGIPSVVLCSADFGVPQTRRRCYAGEGWAARPSHAKEEWVSVIEALPDLADELRFKTPERLVLPIQRKVGVLKANGRILQPIWREMDEPAQTITGRAESLGKIMVNTAGGGASESPRLATQDSEIAIPCKTIHNNTPSLRDTTDKPVKIRSLTLPETLILQGFNPDYDLSAARTMKSRWTMVGNAVPPPVAEAVIRGIVNDKAN